MGGNRDMFKILAKKELGPKIYWMKVEAARIAQKRRPGQFIIIRSDEYAERIPLTIYKSNPKEGTIEFIFYVFGQSTAKLATFQAGDYIMDVIGPLGKPTEISLFGTVICVGGGAGIPLIYPIARALKEVGNKVISIIGARTRNLLILEEEIRSVSDEVRITTDDGSYVRKGFVTDVLKEMLESGENIDFVLTVGPVPMMSAVAEITRPYNIKTIASLNPIMVDGTGMCGACRVTVGGKTCYGCIEGPEFDAHLVDFKELAARNSTYKEQEKLSYELFLKQQSTSGGKNDNE